MKILVYYGATMEPPNASQTLIFILDRKVADWLAIGWLGCQKDYYNNDNETSAMRIEEQDLSG